MAIYIEDMNMPPEGSTFLIIIHPDGTLTNLKGAELKATAIEVPDHGRLIDRDELIEHLKACFQNGRPMHNPDLAEILEMIENVETIIPAEEETCTKN